MNNHSTYVEAIQVATLFPGQCMDEFKENPQFQVAPALPHSLTTTDVALLFILAKFSPISGSV